MTDRIPATSSADRLERRRALKRQSILRAAGDELATSGFGGASMDDIAERVNVRKASLYHYFDSKEALYREWMTTVTVEVRSQLEPLATAAGSPSERLSNLITQEVVLLTTEFPEYARLFLSGIDWPESFQGEIRKFRRAHEQLFRQVIDEGIATGEFSVVDETVARYCLQGVLVYLSEWFRPHGRLDPETLAEKVAATVLRLFIPTGGNAHET